MVTRVERKYVWGLVTGFRDDMVVMFREAKEILQIPSFQVIIGQGVPGTVPRKTLNFMPMWLELIGYSHKTSVPRRRTNHACTVRPSIWINLCSHPVRHFPRQPKCPDCLWRNPFLLRLHNMLGSAWHQQVSKLCTILFGMNK
jgi:hypothetical protein